MSERNTVTIKHKKWLEHELSICESCGRVEKGIATIESDDLVVYACERCLPIIRSVLKVLGVLSKKSP